MQSPQSFPQLQLLSPQQQQQLLLQAQQNTTSQLAGDVDSRRLRMILNNRNVVIGKDALSSAVGDVVQNIGSPMQAASPVMPHGSADILFKVPFSADYFSLFWECKMWLLYSRLPSYSCLEYVFEFFLLFGRTQAQAVSPPKRGHLLSLTS